MEQARQELCIAAWPQPDPPGDFRTDRSDRQIHGAGRFTGQADSLQALKA